jgi:hypothetical protein
MTGNATVNVNPRPTVILSGSPTICQNGTANLSVSLTGKSPWTITYTEDVGGTITSTTTTITGISGTLYTSGATYSGTFSVTPSASATYSITGLTDGVACAAQSNEITGSASVTVTTAPSIVSMVTATSTICNGQSTIVTINLSGTTPYNFTYTANGLSPSTITGLNSSSYSFTVNPSETTNYSITSLSGPGCSSNSYGTGATLIVNPRPTAVLSGANTTCVGTSSFINVALTGQSPWILTYESNDGITITSTTITITASGSGNFVIGGTPYSTTISVSPSAPTNYSITGLSDALCSAISADLSGSASVQVNTRPTSILNGTPTICNGTATTINVALTGKSPWVLTYQSNNGTTVTSTTINITGWGKWYYLQWVKWQYLFNYN